MSGFLDKAKDMAEGIKDKAEDLVAKVGDKDGDGHSARHHPHDIRRDRLRAVPLRAPAEYTARARRRCPPH